MVAVGAMNPAAALLNARFEEQRARLASGNGPASAPDIWLRQGAPGGQIVMHARKRVDDGGGGGVTLRDVSIFIQTVSPAGAVDFTRRIDAAEAVLAPGAWRLSDVKEARPGSESVRSETLALPTTLDRRSAMERFVAPGAVAFWTLPATARAAERAGFSSAAYRLRFQQLLATPLLLAAMTLLAAAFSLRLLRLGDLARVAAAGVGLGFLVFFLGQVCGALGATEVIPVALAAWTPPMLALLGALTLLCHTEDG
jgi:lipopolysaccharide export system permease protein